MADNMESHEGMPGGTQPLPEDLMFISTDDLMSVFDGAPFIMGLYDSDFNLVSGNSQLRELSRRSTLPSVAAARGGGVLGCRNALDDEAGCGNGARCGACPLRQSLADTLINGTKQSDIEFRTVLQLDNELKEVVMLCSTARVVAANRQLALLTLIDITERKRHEDELRESEYFFRESQRAAFIGSYKADVVSGIWESSEILDQIFGIGAEYQRNIRGWLDIVHPEDRGWMADYLTIDVMAGKKSFDMEYRIIRKNDGEVRWVHGLGEVVFDAAGSLVSLIGTIRDITERKIIETALRVSNSRFRAITESAQEAIMMLDPDGRISFWNKAAERIFGYSCDEAIGQRMHELIVPESLHSSHVEAFARFSRTGHGQAVNKVTRLQGRSKRGEIVPIELSLSSIYLDDGWHAVGLVRDISETLRIEHELNRKNSELEQFIYTVSHDLRSPLVTVKTFLGFLAHDLGDGTSDLVQKDIGYIHSAADRMEVMLNDLLEISRVGRTEAYNEEIEYRELLADSVAALAGQISLNNVDVQVSDADIVLCGDRGRLTRIWQNLLENAIKYMGNQPVPRVELGVEQHHGELTFFVRDNGLGIHPDYQEKIFGIFEQLDRSSGGVGMGLTMVRRIVEMYGGSIRVESEGEGSGSRFVFTLPRAVVRCRCDEEPTRDEAQLLLPAM